MNKWLPPSDVRVCWMALWLGAFRCLAQWKATTSSGINQARFRPKKGHNTCLLSMGLLFKGSSFSKAQGAPHGQRKEGLVSDKRPTCTTRSAPQGGEGFPTGEAELGHQHWVLTSFPRDLPSFFCSLPEVPLTAISRDRLFGTLHFSQDRGSVRQTNFSIPESRNHRTWQKQHRTARKHLKNNLYWIQCIPGVLFWPKCS